MYDSKKSESDLHREDGLVVCKNGDAATSKK